MSFYIKLWPQLEGVLIFVTIRKSIDQNSNKKNKVKWFYYSIIPRDSLDIILSSQYNHSNDLFGDKNLTVLQDETCDKRTFRRLRNTKDVEKIIPLWHPLKIGGIPEKNSPHSVKLMNHGPHTPLTNPGYSRQNFDGNVFNY